MWISILGFAFDSVTGAVGGQQLQCTVQICNPDDASSPCKTGCFEPTLEATTQAPTTATPSQEQLLTSMYKWSADDWIPFWDLRRFSSLCNPNFIDSTGADCATYAEDYDCARTGQNTASTRLGWSADNYAARAVGNPKLKLPFNLPKEVSILWETGLQCPQCGCTDERGTYSLNNIFRSDKDDEDFWYGKWLMVSTRIWNSESWRISLYNISDIRLLISLTLHLFNTVTKNKNLFHSKSELNQFNW